uniref:Serpentine Receptor, class E (Epsilon) n=1 Tax=Haemonchus contortus TaxID=6289 RepID=A0A7I4Y3I3_HAECO
MAQIRSHYVTYFNRTDAQLHGYWQGCKALLITEIALVIFSFFYYILTAYMMIKTFRYQKNLRNIWVLCTVQYLFSTIDRVIQAGMIILENENEGIQPSRAFLYTSYIRAFGIFMALYSLPIAVTERCFATYFLEDYEKKQRSYLGYILVLILLAMAALSSYIYHRVNSTIFLFVVIMVLNNIGVLVNSLNYKLNKRYYWETMSRKRGIRAYSLGERYQIAENIRACQFVNHTVLWVGFLNMIASIALIVNNFDVSIFYRNVAVLIFEFSIIIYGLVVPVVIYCHNESWKIELNRLRHKAFTSSKTVPFSVSVKSTLGSETNVERANHADLYFIMLQKDLK